VIPRLTGSLALLANRLFKPPGPARVYAVAAMERGWTGYPSVCGRFVIANGKYRSLLR
jgi:hypothetical protein